MLLEFRFDQRERERCAVHRAVDKRQDMRDGADVIFMPVREDQRANASAIGLERSEIGNDKIDAEQLRFRKHDAGIEEHSRVSARDEHHIHAELAHTSERHDINGQRTRAVLRHQQIDLERIARTRAGRERLTLVRATQPRRGRAVETADVSILWAAGKTRKQGGKTAKTIP